MIRATTIENHLRTAQHALAGLQTERNEAIMGLVDAPDDANLQAALEQLRVEIPHAENRVAELTFALVHAKQADTSEARAAERARLQSLRDDAINNARKRAKLGADIDKAVAALERLLDDWSDAGTQIRGQVRDMVRGSCPDITLRERYMGDLLRLSEGISEIYSGALATQLRTAGLFEKGILNADIRDEFIRIGVAMTVEQASELAAERITRILSKFEAMADEQLGELK